MATYYATQVVGELDGATPTNQMSGSEVMSKLRRSKASINLASQAAIGLTDAVVLAQIPIDGDFAFGIIIGSVTLATSTIAIGTNATHASNGQYRAAAVQTAVDAPALFGLTAAVLAAPVTAPMLVYLTTGTAALPTVGLVEIDIYFTSRS